MSNSLSGSDVAFRRLVERLTLTWLDLLDLDFFVTEDGANSLGYLFQSMPVRDFWVLLTYNKIVDKHMNSKKFREIEL